MAAPQGPCWFSPGTISCWKSRSDCFSSLPRPHHHSAPLSPFLVGPSRQAVGSFPLELFLKQSTQTVLRGRGVCCHNIGHHCGDYECASGAGPLRIRGPPSSATLSGMGREGGRGVCEMSLSLCSSLQEMVARSQEED